MQIEHIYVVLISESTCCMHHVQIDRARIDLCMRTGDDWLHWTADCVVMVIGVH